MTKWMTTFVAAVGVMILAGCGAEPPSDPEPQQPVQVAAEKEKTDPAVTCGRKCCEWQDSSKKVCAIWSVCIGGLIECP